MLDAGFISVKINHMKYHISLALFILLTTLSIGCSEQPPAPTPVPQTPEIETSPPITIQKPGSTPFFEVLECPKEVHVGDYLTIVAKTNYHLFLEYPTGVYVVEGILGVSPDRNDIVVSVETQVDSDGILRWHFRFPSESKWDASILASEFVPGTLRLEFWVKASVGGESILSSPIFSKSIILGK